MGIMKGLKAMEKAIDHPRSSTEASGMKVRWLKLEDGQSIKVRFVNELDEDSPNFDKSRDLAIVVSEHTNPKDYKRKAVCTMDSEGRCFGCEMHRRDPKAKWGGKKRFYANVIVDDGIKDGECGHVPRTGRRVPESAKRTAKSNVRFDDHEVRNSKSDDRRQGSRQAAAGCAFQGDSRPPFPESEQSPAGRAAARRPRVRELQQGSEGQAEGSRRSAGCSWRAPS